MLVLTRKVGESLVIGGNVIVTVVSQKGGQVRLGIDAPASVSIQRQEITTSMPDANDEVTVSFQEQQI